MSLCFFEVDDSRFDLNDLPVSRDLCYAQRILGSPGGKHCKSLERNV